MAIVNKDWWQGKYDPLLIAEMVVIMRVIFKKLKNYSYCVLNWG